MTTIKDIIKSYTNYLLVKKPTHHQQFCNRLKNNNESTTAEAILFSTLRSECDNIDVSEDISTGGVDFLCKKNDLEFVVEVTCLESSAVEKQSGITNKIENKAKTVWYSMITNIIRTKVSGKTRQLSGYPMPRVLAITTEHIGGNAVFGTRAAEFVLTGETKISIPIGETTRKSNLITDLSDSVFFRFKNNSIDSCRNSISAIILVQFLNDKCNLLGILHPDPVYQFHISLLPNIPFLRLKSWPIKNNQLETEWVIHKPSSAEFYYQPISFTNEELINK